ncbi:tripartite motif-containing protein 65-like [Mya arenaria]|uniref:tripartite motif-containing protein 65-like n=1 Tax=Mya arenaria TaxID=6604 RepID=UPI0022E61C88|nr:tripartite motif-containing protein 65-like [Mya arenaria]
MGAGNSCGSSKDVEEQKLDSTRKHLQIENLILCSLCLERYKDPRMLSCQHTFCFNCIKEHIRTAEQNHIPQVSCPQCKVPVLTTQTLINSPPEKWERLLPRNITIEKILDNLPTDEEYCDVHADKLYEYFCEADMKLCCSSCILEEHKNCKKVTPILEFTDDNTRFSGVCKKLLAELKKAVGHTHTMLNQLRNNVRKLEKDKESVFKQLEEFRASIMNHIENNEKAIKEEITDILNNKYDEIEVVEDLDEKFKEYEEKLSDQSNFEAVQKLRALTIVDHFSKEDFEDLQTAQTKIKTVTVEFVLDSIKMGIAKKQLTSSVGHFLVYDRPVY